MLEARDYLGQLLARTWSSLSADDLEYAQVARAVLRADFALTGGTNAKQIRECFAWREIAVADARVPSATRSIENVFKQGRDAYRIEAPTGR